MNTTKAVANSAFSAAMAGLEDELQRNQDAVMRLVERIHWVLTPDDPTDCCAALEERKQESPLTESIIAYRKKLAMATATINNVIARLDL